MDRRNWIKSTTILSGGVTLTALPFSNLLLADSKSPVSKIEEIHLTNLSHHDYGYTDLPSSVWDYQVNNIRQAMKFIEETKSFPEESRFKWTIEGLWGLERFWSQASQEEKMRFESMVAQKSIEVTAMPGNMTCLVESYEWEKEMDRLSFFHKKFTPSVALQDDVNGLPWGMVESLLNRNIKYVTMAANAYIGGKPIPAPSFFWWQGASNKKILMYNGEGYANGYDYFHTKEWRKGPVPNRYDVWFNSPSGNEIFSSKKEDLLISHQILKGKLEALYKQGYNHSKLLLTFTNHWTIDNDLPCRQLSNFIRAWNELNLQPKLIFSTPSHFIDKVKGELPSDLKTLHGEWCDWWADGVAASPFEVSLLQAAKRRNRDIGNALNYFSTSSPDISSQIEELNHELVFASEHTWGAYDSVAHPYNARTSGNHIQKFDYFFKSDENSKRIQAEIIRTSKFYKPFSQTSALEVLNPGKTNRSGWVELSAGAFRKEANGVRETATGRFFPFEVSLASEWQPPQGASSTPAEIPNDVWPFRPGTYKFHIENLKAGEKRKYELANEKADAVKPITSSKYFKLILDEKTREVKNIVFTPLNKSIFDEKAEYLPGQLVIERPQGAYSRDAIAERRLDPKDIKYSKPLLKEVVKDESAYALRHKVVLQEDFAKRIEQQWDIFDAIPRIEITTTLWTKENLDPLAVYMAFPFAVDSPKVFYDSMGSRVEVGRDQMANTCGAYNTIQNGVSYQGKDISLALTTLDLPMGIFHKIVRWKLRPVFKPETGHFYNMVCENYWLTNFAVLSPFKLVIRHIIECDKAGTDIRPIEGNDLWEYPSV